MYARTCFKTLSDITINVNKQMDPILTLHGLKQVNPFLCLNFLIYEIGIIKIAPIRARPARWLSG